MRQWCIIVSYIRSPLTLGMGVGVIMGGKILTMALLGRGKMIIILCKTNPHKTIYLFTY